MRLVILISSLLVINAVGFGQNVGIDVQNPEHKLDVKGDINLTGTIRANGLAGSKDQVLASNGSGAMFWTDFGSYQQFETFTSGTGTWTVPAGVTRILVEVWGGGGGGSCVGGGGGGGYICAYFTVTPGSSVAYTVGGAGSGTNCANTTPNPGLQSTATANGITIRGLGGSGSYYAGSTYFLGRGGGYSVSNTAFRNWRGIGGEDGTPNVSSYLQPSSGVYWQQIRAGDGGNGGNSTNTKSYGGLILLNGSSVLKYVTGGDSKQPGGGGNGNSDHSASYYGGSGAAGMVVINY